MNKVQNVQDFSEKINHLQQWFIDNPKLPAEIDGLLLKRFLKCMNCDVEKTKTVIETNYGLRNKYPNIFIKRDPEDESTKFYRDATDLVALPGLTPQRYKVLLYRLVNLEPRQLNSVEELKIFMMLCDSRFTIPDSDQSTDQGDPLELMSDGDIQIVDLKGYTMSHVARVSILVFRTYIKFLQEAFPSRLRSMHVINCPSYLDKMVAFMRPFISDEVYRMINFHTSGLESLYEFVPREMLPIEYGGTAGTMADLKVQLTSLLNEKRDYLMDSKNWVIEQTANKAGFWSWFS